MVTTQVYQIIEEIQKQKVDISAWGKNNIKHTELDLHRATHLTYTKIYHQLLGGKDLGNDMETHSFCIVQ